jgi:ABC-type phosphate transport system auxiliary subunit
MPPSDFFFSKKRRVTVKRETHQNDGAIVKRQRILYDGQGLDETEFAMEMAGSLCSFSTANQCSVENLVEQLKQINMLVRKLQDQMKTMERDVRNHMNKAFEQVRADDRQQIQQLKTDLDELYQNSQTNREFSTRQE